MRRAAVVAVPSQWPEPFGLVGIEALAEGRPVVACDSGGISDWAREELGASLVPPGRPDLLAEALDRALSDPDQAERAFEKGPDWVASNHSVGTHEQSVSGALAGAGLA
jgi:glycosyltransferase involved in cell wall biosynthesis